MFNFRRTNVAQSRPEQGYSWLFFSAKPSWIFACLVTLLVIGASSIFYVWYNIHGDEHIPGGNVGLSYGLAGFACLLLAAVLYSVRRRFSTLAVGQLHRALNWHSFFALIGLALLFMHSFAAFGPNSGTFALFSMTALTLSGLLGRGLDRVLAWRIAIEVSKVLTVEGEDRMDTITQEVRTLIASQAHKTNHLNPRSPEQQSSPVPVVQGNRSWDLSYRSTENTSHRGKRQSQQHPRLDDELLSTRPGTSLPPSAQIQMAALREVQQAKQREQRYRSAIHAWRQVHIALAFLTLGLTIWHITYEMPFLYQALFH